MGIVFICAWQTLNGQMSLAYFLMFVLFSFVIFGSVENINDAAHMLGLIDSAMNKLEALEMQNISTKTEKILHRPRMTLLFRMYPLVTINGLYCMM